MPSNDQAERPATIPRTLSDATHQHHMAARTHCQTALLPLYDADLTTYGLAQNVQRSAICRALVGGGRVSRAVELDHDAPVARTTLVGCNRHASDQKPATETRNG